MYVASVNHRVLNDPRLFIWECKHRHGTAEAAAKCAATRIRQLTRYGRSSGMPVVTALEMRAARRDMSGSA